VPGGFDWGKSKISSKHEVNKNEKFESKNK
jgi:hypothetical protein